MARTPCSLVLIFRGFSAASGIGSTSSARSRDMNDCVPSNDICGNVLAKLPRPQVCQYSCLKSLYDRSPISGCFCVVRHRRLFRKRLLQDQQFTRHE